ncbi:MAG TPA: Smr/MutS family protein [Bryobacteraceae bacterium]|nr:Smr/MutS family protein [Bryobacteraceae bacterium]
MQNFSADLLEFEPLRELVGRYVGSPLGRAELEKLEPHTDRAVLENALADVAEAIAYQGASRQPQAAARGSAIRLRFNSIPDVAPALTILRIEGAMLEPKQILDLARLIEEAGEVRAALNLAGERYPLLAAQVAATADPRPILRDVRGKILPDGTVADDASVALHRLRRDIERQQRQIQTSLERFLKAHRDDGTLQEEFITLRNDRFVVPVVAGQQRKVYGVIHGASSSGHTLFVEPLDTIDLNNELVRLREEEQREVARILRELTELLRANGPQIQALVAAIARLDLLFAKAEFASDFECVIPRFSPEKDRRLVLRDARHPLLQDVLRRQKKPILPISLALDEKQRTLLISGPNTGGKTVSMKTVGLLALMAQAALPVPATEAEFPVFEQVLAEIGDQQSIQESLSSFSGHIARVREMLETVTPQSLVLLDELGRATDPEEGGPLGVAILESFRAHGAFTFASTHLLALKIFGATTEGVVNASMGFNEKTLQPTYVLQLGAPGKSAGLDIASRLGLSEDLIARARQRMSTSDRDIAMFLNELHQRLRRTAIEEQDLREQRQALEATEQTLAKEFEQREKAKFKELDERLRSVLAEFEAQTQETIQKLLAGGEQRKAAEQAERRVAKSKREFEEKARVAVFGEAPTPQQQRFIPIEEGARVRLKGVREPARVKRKLSGGLLEVEAGLMRMKVSTDDVEEVLPAAPEATRLPKNVSYDAGPRWDVTYREINVIGKRAEEAREEVDKFLDTASMASVDRVRIVHGHGMGILKKVIGELLATNPHVEKYYPAMPAEGGTGATVVELK